jgi:hypothetical protein
MYGVGFRSPRILTGAVVATAGLLVLAAGWRYAHPPRRLDGDAFEAAKAYVTKISKVQSLLFPVLGIDPNVTSRLRHDGDYEERGWVEGTNDWGHRVHRDWVCIVRHGSGNVWNCVYLKLDRFTFGTYSPDSTP